ncbi:neuropeptide Y receptor type 1-like [Ylistrum balloti]|uniref:neuropeptide Y receptor type 1-like n=1 Tax=Ylistrum balloti TaxID=509963 RepID=UPI002905C9F3|nr:neuropeptide Y receptor type 1-like [Ylistrum balloti]
MTHSRSTAHALDRLPLPDDEMLYASNFSVSDFWRIRSQIEFSNNWFGSASVCILVLGFCLITLFGTFGNAAMCYIIIKKKNLKSCRNWYIMNLSLSDILTSVLCIPFTVVRLIMKHWPLGEIVCKVVPSLQTIYVFVSTFTIVLIAVDRYRAIVQCANASRDRTRLMYIFPMVWMVSFALALPMFIFHEVEDVYITKGIFLFSSCLENWDSDIARKSYASVVLGIHFIFPMIVIVSLHILICKFIRTHIESKPSYSRELHRSRRNLLRQRKNIILLTSIAVSFAITWLPLTLTNLLADLNYQLFTGINFNWLKAICHLLAMSSVCINPIIYGWFNSNFRREIKAMMCRKRREKDNDNLLMGLTGPKSSRCRDRIELGVYGFMPTRTDIRTMEIRTAEVRPAETPHEENLTPFPAVSR